MSHRSSAVVGLSTVRSVRSPSNDPLNGTSSPAAAGAANPRTVTTASARLAAELKRFIRHLHVVCGTMERHLPGAQTGRRAGGGLLRGKDPTGRFFQSIDQSSFRIVPTPRLLLNHMFLPMPVKSTKNVSSDSRRASPFTTTVMVLRVWPGRKNKKPVRTA